jgi:glycine betaine/proline transport system permease protein
MDAGRWGLIYVTRWFADGPLEFLLGVTANILEGRHRWPYFVDPLPWASVAAVTGVLGYYLGGWRMALLAGGTMIWTALMGQWNITMQTVSVLLVAAPLGFAIGLVTGIAAWKYRSFDNAIRPLLAIMQTLPFYTYLLPAVIFFKVGPTAGAIATTIYATPPMILMTTIGLRKVSPEVVEAGKMSGATRWQMLTKVFIPTARTEILVGVNQVIMLCLAMIVLTAFIGMPGLGATLLSSMNSFRLGRSLEIGITIVLLAIMLDQMSKAWVAKQPVHFERGTPWYIRHKHVVVALVLFSVFYVAAQFFDMLNDIGRRQSFSQAREIDALIKGFLALDVVKSITGTIRYVLNVWVLVPFRDALLWIPTSAFILFVVAFAYGVGGKRPALYALIFFSLVALSGWWDRSVITLYTVLAAVFLASLFGIPLGIVASRSERWANRILMLCDTAQTFPSFVYLLPAIMLFGITDTTVVLSVVIYTMVPLTRYTIEGLRNVPPEMSEAADMSGATRWQKLTSVQLPLAVPTMAVGFNQAIMFAFFMVIIAAFIGTQDLGQELQRTLAGTDLGKNFVLGICVSLMALTFDMAILSWANRRKKALGL